MHYNIINYGAVADGLTDSTFAIQKAIDICAQNGGGTVVVPAGKFATDMLTLKDNVELHLEIGSCLMSLLTPVPDASANCKEPTANAHRWLIGGANLKNVSITGFGTIDGRGDINFWNKNDGLEHPLFGQRYWPRLHRPKGLVTFRECEHIVIRDVTLLDSPCYMIWLLGCDDCGIANVHINTDLRGPNVDGIDIDCCSNVRIDNCNVSCGDDAIALKSDITALGHDRACENVVISNCTLCSASDGIRIGYEGDGAIRNVAMSNCIIHDSMVGISLMVAIDPDNGRGANIYKGPEITDVLFENIVIDAIQAFNFQHPKTPTDCPEPVKGFMDRIYFRNITAKATRGSFLGGAPESPIRHVEFSGLHLVLTGNMGADFLPAPPDPYPIWSDLDYSGVPWPFFIRHAKDVVIRDCVVEWQNATGAWQADIAKCDDANISVECVKKINSPGGEEILFPVGRYQGVPYYMPPVGFNEASGLKALYEANDLIADEIATLPEDKRICDDYISVSFVYAHPADYYGHPMLNASVLEWRTLFRRFKQMRIDSVIFQSALWRELGECYYRTKIFTDLQIHGVIERMLAAAETEGIKVYLGGYGSVAGWKAHLKTEELERELTAHRQCIDEILSIGKVEGMYFPCETAFRDERLPEKERRMNSLYRNFSDYVKSKNSALKIIVSPATIHHPDNNGVFIDFWNAVLQDSGVDIVMPQDSIGNTGSRLSYMDTQWKAWKTVADNQSMTLWSHTEIFERRGYRPEHNLYPAAPERVSAQLALTAPYVAAHACWEALYFTSDEAGTAGRRLRNFMTTGLF